MDILNRINLNLNMVLNEKTVVSCTKCNVLILRLRKQRWTDGIFKIFRFPEAIERQYEQQQKRKRKVDFFAFNKHILCFVSWVSKMGNLR